ncbi:uncharacterized protein FA14DRAFT_175798 [Meira miltonrushii]|uniref:Uncharacterized protein n=1 Tax=Meira miltonrushii TaxID=1280837 RepID=A0A316VLP7_9BASI|nr:uncharacterized protein FA14DRAFT_175798 [Meira miltonrushii]PWN36485.1 hypothetical protein FA14DRAFT_175798 [Meira miltonrushii]
MLLAFLARVDDFEVHENVIYIYRKRWSAPDGVFNRTNQHCLPTNIFTTNEQRERRCFHDLLVRQTLLLESLASNSPAPSIALGDEHATQTGEQSHQCKWSILVRADDLRIGHIAYGDARLINNMTNMGNPVHCEIARWSLVLRSTEGAAMRYPLPSIELPKEPMWNRT